jgi:hypothetical protein
MWCKTASLKVKTWLKQLLGSVPFERGQRREKS